MSIDRGMDKEDVVHIHNALGFFSFIVLVFFVCLFVCFWLCYTACRNLVLLPGIELRSSAVKAQGPNHWNAGKSPHLLFFYITSLTHTSGEC